MKSYLRRTLLLTGLVLTAQPVWCQRQPPAAPQSDATSPPKPAETYSVASIRVSQGGMSQLHITNGLLTASYMSLKTIIRLAYGVQESQLTGGPSWMNNTFFDITAKSDGTISTGTDGLSEAQRKLYQAQLMVPAQRLLADRFHLKVHTDEKEVPVYALVVARGGPKMKPSTDQSSFAQMGYPNLLGNTSGGVRGIGLRSGEFVAIKATMDDLTRALAGPRVLQELGRPIVNRTDLTGKYDFKLEWTPYIPPASPQPGAPPPPASDTSGPSLFTALQEQLGLRLESQKGPLQILVIDHIEMPTEN